ncbi:PAS domain-containing protein [Kiloniella laminariae]|uniref:PAS domain-containing protein n=1 Tax=Kiloniella laminariae TaxID=454162 RepID=UPI00037673EA|nr:PAS domain-containing protein [Kiloniella laminariae]
MKDQSGSDRGEKIIKFEHPHSVAFFEHWQSLPREGLLPLRSSFLPERVPRLLSTLSIYELVSRDFIKFRLIGTAIRERMGADMTGKNYLDFVDPARREKSGGSFWAVVEQPCAMRVISNHAMTSGRHMFLEVLMVPVENDMGANPVVLCQTNEINKPGKDEFHNPDGLKLVTVSNREFIDIGAGLSSFRD